MAEDPDSITVDEVAGLSVNNGPPISSPNRMRGQIANWRLRTFAGTTDGAASGASRTRKNLNLILRQWHKRAGLFAFLFMGWLGLSGVLINQSPSWGYDTVRVDWSWVMALYGLHPEPPVSGYFAGNRWLASTKEQTVLNGKAIAHKIDGPIGMVAGGHVERPMLFIATPNEVVLLTLDGVLVDVLGTSMLLPMRAIDRIGWVEINGERLVAIDGSQTYISREGLSWYPLENNAQVAWSTVQDLSEDQRESLIPYSRPTVSLEHLLLDAHSGHLFGRFGVYVINAVGLAAILLAVSGVWMMWRTSRRRRAG
ncbi:MAG: PepSY domain-containing protein [Panacagrimonas sp.]